MKFFSPKSEELKLEEYQLFENKSDNSWTENNSTEDLDTGWIQSNDSQVFNDYIEEY